MRAYGQIVIGQIPILIVSAHQRGQFSETRTTTYRVEEMDKERRATEWSLAFVAVLLKDIRAIAGKLSRGVKLSVVWRNDELWVHTRMGGVGLTAEQLGRFSSYGVRA